MIFSEKEPSPDGSFVFGTAGGEAGMNLLGFLTCFPIFQSGIMRLSDLGRFFMSVTDN
jgi:hypothetical protein